jgi:hypothetical protein
MIGANDEAARALSSTKAKGNGDMNRRRLLKFAVSTAAGVLAGGAVDTMMTARAASRISAIELRQSALSGRRDRSVMCRVAVVDKPQFKQGHESHDDANGDAEMHRTKMSESEYPGRNNEP